MTIHKVSNIALTLLFFLVGCRKEEVMNCDEIEFSVPEECAEKEILFMLYLNIHTPEISCKLNSILL